MARPTKLTKDLQERISQLVRAGMPIVDAAEFCNVHRVTIWRWVERGDVEAMRLMDAENEDEEVLESERPYLEFRNVVEHGRAYANVMDLNVIGQAAQNDPMWAERRYKMRNADRFKTQIGLEIKRPSAEELADHRRAEKLRKATNEIRGGVYR